MWLELLWIGVSFAVFCESFGDYTMVRLGID
jgi:hypothetical protein